MLFLTPHQKCQGTESLNEYLTMSSVYYYYYYYYYYIHLTAFFQDNLGKPAPER